MQIIKVRNIFTSLIIIVMMFFLLSCYKNSSEYQKSILQSREIVLRNNLLQMRKLIYEYAFDNGRLPQALADLVDAGYLREIPEDPITGKRDWSVVIGEDARFPKGARGIIDVRSKSSAKSLEGVPYSEL